MHAWGLTKVIDPNLLKESTDRTRGGCPTQLDQDHVLSLHALSSLPPSALLGSKTTATPHHTTPLPAGWNLTPSTKTGHITRYPLPEPEKHGPGPELPEYAVPEVRFG
jgi:hypothetical protein